MCRSWTAAGSLRAASPRCVTLRAELDAVRPFDRRAGHHVNAERNSERREPWSTMRRPRRRRRSRRWPPELRTPRRCITPGKITALPRQHRPDRQRQQQRHHQRSERHVEERRSDRNLVASQAFERHRIERADEHRRGAVTSSRLLSTRAALAADRLKQSTRLHVLRAQREEREAAAGKEHREWRE